MNWSKRYASEHFEESLIGDHTCTACGTPEGISNGPCEHGSCATCGMTGIIPQIQSRNFSLCPQCNAEHAAQDAGGVKLCAVKHCLEPVKGTSAGEWGEANYRTEESSFCQQHHSQLFGHEPWSL